jgi:hypothetical protein
VLLGAARVVTAFSTSAGCAVIRRRRWAAAERRPAATDMTRRPASRRRREANLVRRKMTADREMGSGR